ncbi:hypothetical protein EHS25_008896 [Saitozyma podzolica]|uniref:Uncharacterized protein n=1 Tax=Saitozyma podzolica TaxID=1890683 RepID=A0A427YN52_9TREE|nr:hypothetical protein EHS25_008896 [Saitozyma podzolica]
MQTPAPARSSDAVVTFSDVRSAFTALESSLRALPNAHRLHYEGNLMMVSHAFVSEDEFRAFAFSGPSWDRTPGTGRTGRWGSCGLLPLPPLSPRSLGSAFTSATTLWVLSDRLARFGKPPPASHLTTEMSSVWVNASSLVYRLGQLPPHV